MPDPRADNLDPKGAEPQAAQSSQLETTAAKPASVAAETAQGPPSSADVLRRAFVARVVARSSAPSGAGAAAEIPAASPALRSAYLTHLTEGKAEAAGDWELHGGEPLRHAYLMHAAAHSGPEVGGTRRGASTRQRKQPKR